jgi:proteasome accessory factor A
LLKRHIGLETEFYRRASDTDGPVERDSLQEFESILLSLRRVMPIARSENPLRWFLANGSSLSLELGASANTNEALLELATPETSSPKELVAYQLANEQLIAEASLSSKGGGRGPWMKANVDAFGHTMGQHESYDMRIASGGWLIAWWFGLIMLFPLVVLYRVAVMVWFATLVGCKYLAMWATRYAKRVAGREDELESGEQVGSGEQRLSVREYLGRWNKLWGMRLSDWELRFAAWGVRWLHLPLVSFFYVLIWVVALRVHRQKLSAFLASRCILDGAGYLDEESRYWISLRAAGVDRVVGFGSYNKHRPMFRCDPMLRELLDTSDWTFRSYGRLFWPVQRIELAIGDSGMCQQSQWLRFGTTALVLDWIEQSQAKQAIEFRRIPEVMREYARDWMLVRSVGDRSGNEHKAKDVSRSYLRGVKRWLEQQSDVPREAWEIIEQWQITLNQLVLSPSHRSEESASELPMMLVGRLDWLSKLWLLQQLSSKESGGDLQLQRAVRKKIDLRYHELSSQGYHRQLEATLGNAPMVNARELDRAKRSPPSGSSAWRRGSLIREMQGVDGELGLVVEWNWGRYYLDGDLYVVNFRR